jgi:hypothetical protein
VKKIVWSERARADIHRLDRDTAMRIFAALLPFAETGEGDIKKLQESPASCASASVTTASASPKNLTTPSASTPSVIARMLTAEGMRSGQLFVFSLASLFCSYRAGIDLAWSPKCTNHRKALRALGAIAPRTA